MKLSEYLKQNNMTTKEYFAMQDRRSKGKTTLTDYRREKKNSLSQTIGFDTFETDLNAMGTTIIGIYDGWQTPETMNNTRASIEGMHNRINAYNEYQRMFGGTELTEVANSYNTILGDWDNRTSVYGQFKNADAYNIEKKKLDLSDKFRVKTGTDAETGEDTYRGLTFDEVQAKLKEYAPDSDEYKFLSTYTGYEDLNDFNKALENANAKYESDRNNWLNSEEGKNAQRVYDNWDIPTDKVGQLNKEATKENGVITYYTQNDVAEAEKARDEYLRKVLGDEKYSFFTGEKTDAIKELATQKNQWALDNSFDLYKDIMQNEDFEENSKYWDGHTIAFDNQDSAMSVKKGNTIYYDKDSGTYYVTSDPVYEYINNQNNARNGLTNGFLWGSNTALGNEYKNKGYDRLKPEEVSTFNYIDATEGREAAQKFLDDMEITLTKRTYDEKTGKWENAVDSNGWAAAGLSALSIPANLVGALGGMVATVDDFIHGKEYNPYHAYRTVGNFASDTRQYTSENIAEATEGWDFLGQNIPSFLYNTAMSVGDSALGVATLGGAYTAFAGSTAFQQKAKELTEAGEDQRTIYLGAIASGAAEMVFEKFSVDKLLKIKDIDSLKRVVTSGLKQAGVEGTEETFTEIANILSDTIIRGDNSELAKQYEGLKRRGFSEREINRELAKQVGSQVAMSFLGGALSGGVMGGTQALGSYGKTSAIGKGIRNNARVGDMLDTANLAPNESAAYEAYSEYMGKGVNADNITNAQLGNLYNKTSALAAKDKNIARGLEKVNTENVEAKRLRELKIGEQTQANGKAASVEGIKIDGGKTMVSTTEGEVSATDITLSQRDAELVAYAESIGREYGEDIANNFIAQYDGKTDVVKYANSFNLVTEYAKHNYDQGTILENKGVLSNEQVKSIYETTVKATFEAQQKAINDVTERQSKTVFVKGEVDDSIIDYDSKTTDGSKVNWNSLTSTQRGAIKFVQLFSKATGVNVKLFKSEVVNGKHKGENGSYNPETNTITIDVYAGRIDAKHLNDSIIPTLSHEITHWMKAKAPSIYNSIREDVLNTLAKDTSITRDERIDAETRRIKKNHPDQEVTPEDAIDEIVARACEDMLSNSNAARKLLAKMSATEQQNFIDKVKETFENLIQWINDLLSQYKSDSAEAKFLREYKYELKKISKQWDAMLTSAIESNQALQNEGIIAEELVNGISKDGITIVGKNNIQMSERTYENGGREFLENWLSEQKGLTEEDKADILRQTDMIKSLMEDIRANNELPDYANWASMDVVRDENGEKVLSVIVKNGDYAMNIDFSQVCKKRVALNAVLNAMVQSGDLNAYTLTETDVADLNAIIKEHEFEIACALCFVDSKRYRVGSWAESFCEGFDKKKGKSMVHQYGFNEMVRSLIPKDSNIKVDEFNFTNREIVGQPTSNLLSEMDDSQLDFTLIDEILEREFKAGSKPTDLYAYAKAIKNNKNLRKILNPAEIVSSIGLDAIRLENKELYSLINRHQGTARPKFAHDVVAYTNDILKANNFTKEKAKMVGGVRCQSFSDFMANMVFDYVQFISELSAKELTAHSYTKEPLFVKLFGMTGMKINMSLVPKAVQMTPEQQKYFAILNDPNANKRSPEYKKAQMDYEKLAENAGLDENGNYIWEDETFPYDVAMELVVDPRYSANCGTIAVGISDNHILKLLNDDKISMVIPYHKSGLNHAVAMMRNINLYNDYTAIQNTRFANGKKLEKVPDFDFYGDLYGKDGKEGTHDPKKTAENYLKWCDEHNYIPKFEKSRIGKKFRDNPNYYKLLIDFRVYDTDGTYREQQAVKPIYPEKEEFRDLLLNGVVDKNGKVYGGLKQQQATSDKLDAESKQIVDEFKNKLKDKYGKDVLAVKNADRDSDIRYADIVEISDEEYSELLKKKPIKVTNETRGKVGSQRIKRYADISEEEIPIVDFFRVADYNKVNVAYRYTVRNDGKHHFTIIRKQQIKPQSVPKELNKLIQEERENARVNSRTDKSRNGQYDNSLSDNRIGYGGTVQADDRLVEGGKESYKERHNGQDLSNNGREIKQFADRDYSITDNRAAFTEKHINDLYDDYSVSSTSETYKDYAQAYVAYINPSDFLSLTSLNGEKIRNEAVELDLEKLQAKDNRELPYLEIDEETGEVYEHDGRHRLVAFENAGIEQVAIRLLPISQENKYHRKKTEITLKGQEFNWRNEKGEVVSGKANGKVTITAYPLSPSCRPEIEELFGTGKMQYSDRMEESVYDKMGETKRLETENAKLKADIERLKERLKIERQVTHGNYFNKNQLDAVAGHIRKIAGSTYSKVELVKLLDEVYSYIAQSEELNWDDLYAQCCDVARSVLEESKGETEPNDYYKEILNDIRSAKFYVNEGQKGNAKAKLGNRWHQSFFGKTNISSNAIMSLDEYWKGWSEAYPQVFDASISDADQLVALYNIYDDVRDASEVVVDYDREEQMRWLAKEIYNQYWNVSTIKTTADRYDKQIKRLNFEHRKAMQEFRNDYNERLEKQRLADTIHYTSIIRDIRNRKDKQIAEAKQYGKERLAQYKDNAERKTKIQSITSNALTLNKWLIKNSKDEHIHESLKGPVVALLQAIDFSSKRMLDKNIPTQKDISLQRALSKVKDMMADASVGKEELVALYGHDMDEDIKDLVESVDNILRTVGDNEYVLNQMSLEELQTLDKLVKTIKHSVTAMNQFHAVNHARGIANLSQESMEYLDSLGKENVYKGLRGAVKKLVEWNNALPFYAFKRYGKGGQKVFEAFQDGWDKFAFHIKKIIDFSNSVYDDKDVKEWSKEIKSFKILEPATDEERQDSNYKSKHQTVQMSVPQIMSLYCLWKREQARGHILGGGVRIADIEQKDKIISQSEGINLTYEDITKIIGTLSKKQIEVADKLQEFMNTVCSDWGNEVSMLRFGYKAFGEENYFPIQSDKNNLATEDETEKSNSLFRLLNMSFTKSLTDKANNRIVISDIFDVFAQHTSDMAKYNALALPVLDAFKWYNYKEKEMKGDTTFKTYSVKQSIENAFGKDGQNYFTTFLKDLNGDKEVSRDNLGGHFFTNAKIAAVGLNLRVVFLQPTSYVRASAIIDNKYLSAALLHKPKIDKAKKYCGMALWKSMGYYDTDVQRGVADQIKHSTTWRDKAVEVSMWGASKADELTWGYLWNACELEVRRTQKDLKVGSEEFYQAIAKRLREVIYSTQVVDSTMTRSQMMRGSNMYEKMLTAFASEPTLAYNMLQDVYMEMRLDGRSQGKKIAFKNHGKKMVRVVVAYTLTNVMAAIVEAGFDAFRDDDDEEMDLEEFMKLFLSNFASDMSITAKIPIIKEAHSFVKGFSSSRTDLQWMENIVNLFKNSMKMVNGDGDPVKIIKNLLKTTSDLSGVAFYNVYRDLMAALNKLDILTAEDLEELFDDFF